MTDPTTPLDANDPPETLPTSEPLPDPDERDPEDGIVPPEDEDVGE